MLNSIGVPPASRIPSLTLAAERAQVEVARHRLDPRVGDADERLGERLVVVADALQLRARGGALGAFGERAAAVLEVELRHGARNVWPARHRGRCAHGRSTSAAAWRSPGSGARCRRGPRRRASARAPTATGATGRAAPGPDRAGGPAGACSRSQISRALVAGQRHPLGEHVVGVRQARASVRPRLVGERDAVLVEQAVGLGQVGDDRPVRIDQVGVRGATGAASVVGSVGERPPHAQEARGRGTSPTPPR